MHKADDLTLAAVLTAYRPDESLAARFTPLLQVCRSIIVVDNTPHGHAFGSLPIGFVVLQDGRNKGLGPALNIGLREASERGAEHVILFDQDSTPSIDFILQLKQQFDALRATAGSRCCLGPTHLDDGAPVPQVTPGAGAHLLSANPEWKEVTCLPTSGMIVPLCALDASDIFSDEFFLDLVDFEWCWRLGAQGWHFYRSSEVTMLHRLGVAERRFLGLTFHVPAPYRHYFQVRDSLCLLSLAYVPLYSKVRLVGILPLKMLLYPLILDRGFERLRWMLRGLCDRLRGVRGVGAAAQRLST